MSADSYPVRWAGGLAVVSMPAEIDVSNAPAILERLLTVLDRRPQTLIVDMSATGFCDSAGVNMLLRAHKRAVAQHAQLRLAAPARSVRRVLGLTGLDRMMDVHPSLAASLAAGRQTAGGGNTAAGGDPAPPGHSARASGPPEPADP